MTDGDGDAESSKYASPSQDKMAVDARSAATVPGFRGAWPGGGIVRRDIAAVEAALFHCTSSGAGESGLVVASSAQFASACGHVSQAWRSDIA